jgi:RNA polymerase sigma-70 factor (ECF subfamily)
VSDETIAQDVVQEVFIHIWEKRDELNIQTTIEGYLVRSTINRALNYIEKNKKVRKVELKDHLEFEALENNDSITEFDNRVFEELIHQALDGLPAKCKAIFILSRFENMKNKEISAHLEISVKTVENQITIALSRLNKDLKPKLKSQFPGLLFLFMIFLKNL